MDELSPLASVKGVLTAELVAELLGENYVPTEGKTLEEVGEEISAADSRGLRELAKGFLRAGGEAKGREFLQALLDEMLSGKTA